MATVYGQFALANPVSMITGKDRNDLTREDLLKVIQQKNIERITFNYTAIDGKIKELKIPVDNRKHAELILTEGERVDGSSLFKGIIDAGKSDLYVVPVYKTAFLNPFDEGSLNLVCRFFEPNGELASFTPDNILAKSVSLLKSRTGLELHALGELEFYLLSNLENNTYPIQKQRGYHASSPFVKTGEIISLMLKYLTQITGNVKYAHNEVGCLEKVESDFPELDGKSAEQVEIEFLPTPIEETGDIIVIAKWLIRNIAYYNDYVATFVPKLQNGHAGNGMHFHMALMDKGRNIMTNSDGSLSTEARQLVGGLCAYAPSLTAFGNMVSAAYLRLVPNQEAPTKVCWSEMNRSAMIRVPLGWGNVSNLAARINPQQTEGLSEKTLRQTVELRSPDGSAFTHLLLSGLTMAAEWGLTHKKEALDIAEVSHVKENIHGPGCGRGLGEIATSCVESSEKLLQSRDMYERDGIFPPLVISHFAKLLQNENDKDLNHRLMSLPDDEKLKESMRIMHRDIHRH